MKKILVTGGAGFIGSNLCEELVKDENNKVYSLDNYSTGLEENHINKVEYIRGDTRYIKAIDVVPDIIYHLGEYSRVEQSFTDIQTVFEYNQQGTFQVLEFCKEHKCKLVYAGSSTKFSVEGKSLCPYAYTKTANTELIQNYAKWFDLDYAIVYFYNVYGNKECVDSRYGTLVAKFKDKMLNNKPLTIVQPGTQKRNFTHIDDTIEALVLVGEKGYGDNYGIASDEALSILDVAELFKGEINFLPPRKGNRDTARVVTEKTKGLGWTPKRNLKEYIDKLRGNQWLTEDS